MVDFSYPLYKIGANARASRVRSVPLKTTQRPSQSSGSDFAEWSSSDIITPEQITGGIDPETGLVVEGTRQRQVSDATRLLNNPRVTDEGDRSFLESITGAAGNAVGALAGGALQGMDQVEQWIPGKQWKPSTTTMSIMEGLGRAGTVMNMIYQDVMPNFAKGSLSNMNEIVSLFVEGGDEQAIKDWGEWATSTNTQLLEKSGRSETGDLGAQDYLDVLRGQRAKVEERLGLSDLGAGSFNAATSTIDRDHVFWSNPVMANWLSGERLITGAGTDIVLDPLTYVTGGTAGIGAKATLPIVTGALERTTLKVARDLVEGGVAKMAKELAEQSYAAAKYADDPLARRLATELTPKVQRLIGDPSLKHITTVEEALGELINLQTKRTIGLGDGARVIDLDPAKWTVGAAAGTNTTNVFQSMVDEIAGEIQNKSFGRYVDDTSWWRTFEDGVRAQSDVAMKPWMLGGLRISNPVISPRMANKAIAIPGTQGMKRAITKPVRSLIRGTEVGTKADDWARTRLTRLFNKNSAELTEAARLGASNPARGSYSKVVAARAEHEWAVTAAGLDVALQTIEAADNNVKTLFAEKLGKKEGAKLFDTYLEVMSDGEFNKLAGKIDDETMAAVRTAYDVQRKAYNTMQTEYLRWDPDMADFLRHANYQPMIKTRQAQKWLDNFTKTPDYASRVPELNDPDRFAEFAQAVQNSVKHGGPEITEEHIWIFRQLIDQHTGQVAHLAPQATPSHQQFRKLGRNYVHVIKDDGSSAMRTELTDIAELDQAMNAIVNYINTSRKIPTKWKTGTTTPRTGLKRYQYNIDGFFELDPTIRMTEYVTDIHVGISTRAQAVMGFKYGFIVKNGKYIKPGLVKELYDINTAHVPLDNFLLNRVKQMEAQEIEILLAKASTVTHTVAGRQFRYPVDMASEHMIQVLDNLDLIFRGLEEQAPGLQRRFNSAVIRIKQQNPDFTIEEARSAALRTALPSLYEAQETFLLGLSEEVAAYASGLQDWFSVVGAGELEAAMHSRVITGARADKLLREYNRLEREIIQDAIGAGEVVQGRTLAGRELENLATEMQISQAAKIKAAKNEVSALRAAHAAQVNATDPLGHEAQRLAAELNTATEALRILEEGPRKVVKARRVYTSNEHYAPPGVAEALGVRHEIWDAGSKTQGTALNMVKQSDATILFWHPSWSSQTPGQAKLDLNWFVERITTGEVPERVMTSYDDMWDFFNANFTPIGNGVYVSRPHTKNKIVVVAAFDTIDGAPTSMAAAQRALGDADTISVVGWPEVLDTGGSRRVVDTDIFWSDTAEHKATLAFEELQPAAPTDLADRLTKLKERAAKGRMTPAELESLERIEQAYIRAKNRAADHNVDGYLVEDVAKALFIPVEDFIAMNREVIRPLPGASNRRFQLEMLRGEHGRIATPVVDDDNVRKIAYQAVPRDTVIPPIPDAPLAPKSIQEAFHSLRESVDILTDEEKAILIDATKGYQASVEGGPVANNLLTPRQRAILELDSENTITFGETVRRVDEIVERRQALRTAQIGPLPLDEVPAWVSAMTPYASIDAGQLDAAWQHMNIAVFEGLDPIDSIEDLIWVLQQHWPPAMDDGMLTKSELRTIAQDWIEVKYHDPDLDAAGRRLIAELDDEVGASMSNETIEKIDLLSGEMRETRQMMSKQGIGASGRRGIREKAEDQLLAFENRFESRHGGIDTPVEFRTHHLERTADEALEVTVGTRGKLSRQGITSEKVYDAPFLEWYLPRGVEVRVPQRMKYQPRQFKATKQTKTPTVRTLQTEDAKATVSGGGEPGQRGWGDVELRNQPSHIPGELDDPGASLLPDEIPEAQYNAPKAQEVMGFPDQYQAIGDYGEFVETTMRTLFDEDMSFNDSLIGAAYDAIRPDFDTKIAQINELLNADPTYRRWLREHGIDQRMAQDVVDSYRATRDVGSLMSGGHALMFEKLVALADARAGIELTPGAATVNRLIHIDNSQFAEMTSKQLGETLKSLGIAGRSKARTKTQRLALLDEVFFGGQPERVETAYLKTPLGDRMANTATLPDGSKLVQIHLGSIIEDYQAGLPYLRGTSELAMATGGRAADALYSIGVEVDDLLAWFQANGGEWAYADFVRYHEYVHAVDPQNLKLTNQMAKEMHANVVALRTIGYPVDAAMGAPVVKQTPVPVTPELVARITDDVTRLRSTYEPKSKGACLTISRELAAAIPELEVRKGSFGGMQHAWTELADGTIVDATADQFTGRPPINIVRPGDADYSMYSELTTLDEQLLEAMPGYLVGKGSEGWGLEVAGWNRELPGHMEDWLDSMDRAIWDKTMRQSRAYTDKAVAEAQALEDAQIKAWDEWKAGGEIGPAPDDWDNRPWEFDSDWDPVIDLTIEEQQHLGLERIIEETDEWAGDYHMPRDILHRLKLKAADKAMRSTSPTPSQVISGLAEGPDTWMLELADDLDIPIGGTYSPSTAKQQSIDRFDHRLKQHNVVPGGGYEVSSAGDARFSAFNARIKGRGNRTIEEIYQTEWKGYASIKEGKGKAPLGGQSEAESVEFYDSLWREWAAENPGLIQELKEAASGEPLTDKFARNSIVDQATSLQKIIGPPTSKPVTRQQAIGKELAERSQMNVDDADVTIAYLPPGIGEKSVGTTKTIRYAMDGVWDKRVSGDLEQVAPYLWRVVNPNGSPTHRTAYVISGPLEDAGVKILAQEVRGRVLNGAGPRPKILKNVAENEAIFKDSMRRVFSESRNESDGFVVPKLVEAPSKVKPAVSVIGTKNATRNAINVGRETSGGVDGGMFGNRYVVTQRQPNGSLIPAVPDTPHPIFTITETVAPRQAAEPQPGLIIPRATGTTSAREVPAPYVAIELRADATRAERLAANRQAVQGYTDDLDRALAANPEFANRVRELAGAELMCPGSHDGMCHSRVLADRVNRINNIADPIREFEAEHARITELNIDRKAKGKPLLDLPKREDFGGRQPQISSQELQDRISMVRNATSIKGKAVSDMVTRFDNVLQAARMNPEQLVATIEQLNRLSSSFNQPDFARLWADRGPALREAVAGLKPGLELQIQWVTDPASGLRSGVLRVVAPGDEAVLFAGKRSDITNMVDDIVAGQLSREDAIARGYGKAVLAADIKQELLDSVGAVADFMQARIGTRRAKYYPAKQLIGEFDVLVKMLNIATSTGRTKGLRSFLGTFAEDGTLTASVAWRNIQRQVDLMDAARGDQLRWWVETALAADAWDDLARYHAWHERQMQYTYSAGYTQKTILDALQKEITRSIDEALYFGRDEVARATKTNKEIFAALLGLEDNARASGYQPLDSAGNKFTQTVAGYGKSTPSAHPPKGYRLTSQQHLVNVLRAAEDAKRELQTSGAKEIVPEGFRDNMDLLDQYIEGLRKTLQAIDKEGVSVGNPPGYLPASDFGFQDTIFTDTFMDPLYAETLSMTKKNARLLFTPYGMAEVSQSMNTMVSLWKRWATVVNPAFHARNMVGGVANGWMIGVKPYHYIKWGPMALKWRRGMQRVGQGNLTAEELEDVLHRVILRDIPVEYHQMFEDAMTTRTLGSSFARAEALAPTSAQLSINPFNPDFLVYQAGGRVMEGMEDVMRLTAFATHYDKGAESAAALVKMVHFDYSDLTPMEQKIKDFIPFYVWSRNNIPLQFRMLLESPGYFRKYEILRSTWNQETLSREDDPNRKAWGTYLAAGEGWLTPWRRGSDEDWAWKMINPQLPFSDLAELPIWDEGRFGYDANPIGSLGIGRTTSYLWDLVGPQYNTFSDITPELDSLDRNAPRGFNGILRALDAIGLPGAKVSRDGDAAWADSINQAINKVAPFWHNWSAASGARASNPYRAADEGWLDGDAPAWWEPMRWGLGLDRFVGRGIGSKWETPKNVYFEQKQVDAIIERITRDARLGY